MVLTTFQWLTLLKMQDVAGYQDACHEAVLYLGLTSDKLLENLTPKFGGLEGQSMQESPVSTARRFRARHVA